MKQKSITFLCILILIILGFSIVSPAWIISGAFIAGFNDGWNDSHNIEQNENPQNDGSPLNLQYFDVAFKSSPQQMLNVRDSINFDNGEKYPFIVSRGTLVVPASDDRTTLSWINIVIYGICLGIYVLLFIRFIRFIININRGQIFEHKNVKLLRSIAWMLISIGLLKCVNGIFDDIMLHSLSLTLRGVELTSYWAIPYGIILLGLLSLVMAQIWNRGLELKEEQELTI